MHDTEGGGTLGRARRWLPAADPAHRSPRATPARALAAVEQLRRIDAGGKCAE